MIDSDADWWSAFAPQLRIVVAVLEEQHITRAARRLGIPQPTVSAVMRRVGEAVGTPLVQQSGRGLIVTSAGHALLPSARGALASLHRARLDVAHALDPDRGRVNLGFLQSRGLQEVPFLIEAFNAKYPDISFGLQQGSDNEIIALMHKQVIDVALVAPLPDDTCLEGVVLDVEQLYLVVPDTHRLAPRSSVRMEELSTEGFVALTTSFGLRQVFESLCAEANFRPTIAFEGQEIAILRGFTRAGLGIAVLPRASQPVPGIVEVPICSRKAYREVGAVWLKGRRLAPAAQRFVELLGTLGSHGLNESRIGDPAIDRPMITGTG
ncbi:LysR family transcriptional regulator [Mycobacterium montefiorense]|uniref:LysR family transcriptional regulator n=1 Tax=Mycobacterium montefiorense TaxID=154654 RepID=UPI0021DEA286|nr:LysR family transcriptional regulator [Mycobacterium montefiorense]MCV7429474.1 LysR family transcriptional regulator [Mycobacterium montefiorense]GLE52232.1 LysR family transcriptional regulator [Mycobacterium montefiorense]